MLILLLLLQDSPFGTWRVGILGSPWRGEPVRELFLRLENGEALEYQVPDGPSRRLPFEFRGRVLRLGDETWTWRVDGSRLVLGEGVPAGAGRVLFAKASEVILLDFPRGTASRRAGGVTVEHPVVFRELENRILIDWIGVQHAQWISKDYSRLDGFRVLHFERSSP